MKSQNGVNIRIAATGDVHGAYMEQGLASACKWITGQRRELGGNLIYLDAGDLLQGGPMAYCANFREEGEHSAARMLNLMGCNAAAIGNHDIEMGPDAYTRFVRSCNFPILAANLEHCGGGESLFKPYTIIECGPIERPVRIAVLGMITDTLGYWVPRSLWPDYRCIPVLESTAAWVKEIEEKEHPHAIVGLFHSGLKGGIAETHEGVVENAVLNVARRISGMDLIIYGHDHNLNCQHMKSRAGGDLLLLNPGSHCKMLVYADLTFTPDDESGEWRCTARTGRSLSLESVGSCSTFVQEFSPLKDRGSEYANHKVAENMQEMHLKEIFHGPCHFMDLLHYVQLKQTGAQISFASPLFIEEVLRKGALIRKDLYKLYRFENMLTTMVVSGEEIKNLLERAYSEWVCKMNSIEDEMFCLGEPLSSGAPRWFSHIVWDFDTACGLDYSVDLSKGTGNRIIINGIYNPLEEGSPLRPFSMSGKYTVVVNSYRACGGGELWTKGAGISQGRLKERILANTKDDIRTLLEKYLGSENGGKVMPRLISRWRFIPKEWAEAHSSDLKW